MVIVKEPAIARRSLKVESGPAVIKSKQQIRIEIMNDNNTWECPKLQDWDYCWQCRQEVHFWGRTKCRFHYFPIAWQILLLFINLLERKEGSRKGKEREGRKKKRKEGKAERKREGRRGRMIIPRLALKLEP